MGSKQEQDCYPVDQCPAGTGALLTQHAPNGVPTHVPAVIANAWWSTVALVAHRHVSVRDAAAADGMPGECCTLLAASRLKDTEKHNSHTALLTEGVLFI
jgi:hypothetical protein